MRIPELKQFQNTKHKILKPNYSRSYRKNQIIDRERDAAEKREAAETDKEMM